MWVDQHSDDPIGSLSPDAAGRHSRVSVALGALLVFVAVLSPLPAAAAPPSPTTPSPNPDLTKACGLDVLMIIDESGLDRHLGGHRGRAEGVPGLRRLVEEHRVEDVGGGVQLGGPAPVDRWPAPRHVHHHRRRHPSGIQLVHRRVQAGRVDQLGGRPQGGSPLGSPARPRTSPTWWCSSPTATPPPTSASTR